MSHNFIKKKNADIIGNKYGFLKGDDIRFEMEEPAIDRSWGFFANKSNRTLVHIKFNPLELDQDF